MNPDFHDNTGQNNDALVKTFMPRLQIIFSPRVFACAVGLILLTAAILKAYDMELFIRQIKDYEIISNRILLIFSAWGLVIAEFVLGTALLIYYLPKISIPLAELLFLVFIGATVWAYFSGVTEDCGCFGSWVKRSPGEAIIEDIIIVAALILAWPRGGYAFAHSSRIKQAILAGSLTAGLVLPPVFGAPVSELIGKEGPAKKNQERFTVQGLERLDLEKGSYLLVLVGADCSHCRDSVPQLNRLARNEDLPELIALSADTNDMIASFVKELEAEFPVQKINEDDFYHLLGYGFTPKTILVNHGKIIRSWDEEMPKIAEIKEALGE